MGVFLPHHSMKRPERPSPGVPSVPSPGSTDDQGGLSAEQYARARSIFCEALDRLPDEREAFLRQACAGDDTLRSMVESLLLNDEVAPDFMETPAMASVGMTDGAPRACLRVGQHLGAYEITAFIGAGGMSEVYRARDPRLGREVAIKVLPQAFTSDRMRLARLEREARMLASLNHPHIATIHGLEESDGIRGLVLELVEGEPLANWITPDAKSLEVGPQEAPPQGSRTGVSIVEALTIARQVADALNAAHRKNIVHRDLKPANIIVYGADDSARLNRSRVTLNTDTASDVRVKVIDFGIAKPLSGVPSTQTVTGGWTADGMMLGTAAYMSPEQARGKPIDQRTDIWAFGCVLYEMLTGRQAFPGETVSDTIAAILEREPDWQQLPAGISPGIRRLLSRCLEKDSTRRLANIGEAIGDLDEALAGSVRTENASPPITLTERRLLGWRRRKLVLAALLAAVVLAATTGTVLRMGAWSRGPAIRSLAVLPFKPLGDNQKENYIGLSVADSIIMRISQGDAVMVRPTSAVRRYATEDIDALDAGETLSVDAVLDGTWQRQDNRVRISVNLLRVSDGSSLWTERFDMRSDDIFILQDQVSDQLASRLRLQLDASRQVQRGRSGTRSMEAYDAYAKGQFYFGERRLSARTNLDTAISLFERAVTVDKDFAEAHAHLGYAYAWTAVFIEDNAALIERAKAELNTAERLEPNLGIVHHARAFISWSKYSDWRIIEALREQRLAAQLDPGLADVELGALYMHLGFRDEWRTRAEQALDRRPDESTSETDVRPRAFPRESSRGRVGRSETSAERRPGPAILPADAACLGRSAASRESGVTISG